MTGPLTYTVEEAAELLGIGKNQCYSAVHSGQIPSIKIGRRLLIPRARLLELLGEPADPTNSDAEPATGPALASTPTPLKRSVQRHDDPPAA